MSEILIYDNSSWGVLFSGTWKPCSLSCKQSLRCKLTIIVFVLGWQWKQFRKSNHPSFWVCGDNCKSGCGSDLATYSHCNLKLSDVNHNGLLENGVLKGDQNDVVNGNHQNGLSNGIVNSESNAVQNGFSNQNGLSNGVAVNGDSTVKDFPFKWVE